MNFFLRFFSVRFGKGISDGVPVRVVEGKGEGGGGGWREKETDRQTDRQTDRV